MAIKALLGSLVTGSSLTLKSAPVSLGKPSRTRKPSWNGAYIQLHQTFPCWNPFSLCVREKLLPLALKTLWGFDISTLTLPHHYLSLLPSKESSDAFGEPTVCRHKRCRPLRWPHTEALRSQVTCLRQHSQIPGVADSRAHTFSNTPG